MCRISGISESECFLYLKRKVKKNLSQTYFELVKWIFSINELQSPVNLQGVILWLVLLGHSKHGGLLSQGVPL